MDGSGLSEIWLKSGILGPGPVELAMSGKAYNKAMRAHKLTLQALWRLLMPSLLAFVAEVDSEVHDEISPFLNVDDPERIPELTSVLQEERFHAVLCDFLKGKDEDVNFTFW